MAKSPFSDFFKANKLIEQFSLIGLYVFVAILFIPLLGWVPIVGNFLAFLGPLNLFFDGASTLESLSVCSALIGTGFAFAQYVLPQSQESRRHNLMPAAVTMGITLPVGGGLYHLSRMVPFFAAGLAQICGASWLMTAIPAVWVLAVPGLAFYLHQRNFQSIGKTYGDSLFFGLEMMIFAALGLVTPSWGAALAPALKNEVLKYPLANYIAPCLTNSSVPATASKIASEVSTRLACAFLLFRPLTPLCPRLKDSVPVLKKTIATK